MGTANQIIHKKIGKRVRIGAIVLSPFILIGVASIIFQLSSGKSGEYALFDFNLGKLWSWAVSSGAPANEAKAETFVPFQRDVIQNIPSRVLESGSSVRELLKTQPRDVNTVKNESAGNPEVGAFAFKPVEVTKIKPIVGYIGIMSQKFFEPMEREFLFSPDIKVKKSRIAIGASFAPSMSFRTFAYSDIQSIARIDKGMAYTYGQSKEYRKRNDKALMNFYSGADIYFQVLEKWSIQSGLYYASHGEKLQVIRRENHAPNQATNASEGSPFKHMDAMFDSPEMVEYNEQQKIPFSNYYGMIELPVLASYEAYNFNDQLSLNLQAGFSYAFLDHADLVLYDYETNQYYWINQASFNLLNRHFINAIGGVSLSQYISKEIEVFANPQFRYSVTPTFSKQYEIAQHQWATGLRLGMKVHL